MLVMTAAGRIRQTQADSAKRIKFRHFKQQHHFGGSFLEKAGA